MLALYGLGTLIGITVGGKVADAHPHATLHAGMAGVIAASAGLAVFAGTPAAVIALVPVLGAAGMATNPAANLLVFAQTGEARTLAGASITSAFNVGHA